MNRSGKSVLFFLAGCMAFTDAVIGIVARTSSDANSVQLLVFGGICLLIIICALVSMYFKNPQFILAEEGHLIPLTVLEKITEIGDPKLVKGILFKLLSSRFQEEKGVNEELDIGFEREEDLMTDDDDDSEIEDPATIIKSLENIRKMGGT